MKLHTFATTLLVGLTAFSAHATTMTKSSNDEVTKVVYSCKDKKTLDVVFVNTSKTTYAIINQVDEMIPMQLTRSASGENYQPINPDYKYELDVKSNTATLFGENDQPILMECVSD